MKKDLIQNDPINEEVQEIIGAVPHWIVRSGTILIFMVLLVVVCLGMFSPFPSTATGEVTIKAWPGVKATQPDPQSYLLAPGASYYALLRLDQSAIADVSAGQEVIIQLDGYPAEVYGVIKGRVDYISDIPVEKKFTVKVVLTAPRDTTARKYIRLRPQLSGTGKIVTTRESLFNRMFAGSMPR